MFFLSDQSGVASFSCQHGLHPEAWNVLQDIAWAIVGILEDMWDQDFRASSQPEFEHNIQSISIRWILKLWRSVSRVSRVSRVSLGCHQCLWKERRLAMGAGDLGAKAVKLVGTRINQKRYYEDERIHESHWNSINTTCKHKHDRNMHPLFYIGEVVSRKCDII